MQFSEGLIPRGSVGNRHRPRHSPLPVSIIDVGAAEAERRIRSF